MKWWRTLRAGYCAPESTDRCYSPIGMTDNENEWVDSDGDGVGDNSDPDTLIPALIDKVNTFIDLKVKKSLLSKLLNALSSWKKGKTNATGGNAWVMQRPIPMSTAHDRLLHLPATSMVSSPLWMCRPWFRCRFSSRVRRPLKSSGARRRPTNQAGDPFFRNNKSR